MRLLQTEYARSPSLVGLDWTPHRCPTDIGIHAHSSPSSPTYRPPYPLFPVSLCICNPSMFQSLRQKLSNRRAKLFNLFDQVFRVTGDEVLSSSEFIFEVLCLFVISMAILRFQLGSHVRGHPRSPCHHRLYSLTKLQLDQRVIQLSLLPP